MGLQNKKNMRNGNKSNFVKRRQKIPFHQINNGKVRLHEAVVKQNKLRARMRSIGKKLSLIPVVEVGTGVDYKAHLKRGKKIQKVLIDIKFSFGALGEGVIATRILNRRLINNADYAFAIDRNNKIHVFKLSKLAEYIRQNFGSLPTSKRIDRGTHFVYPIKLSEFYSRMKIEPIVVELNINGVNNALKQIRDIEMPVLKKPIQEFLKLKNQKPIFRDNQKLINHNHNSTQKNAMLNIRSGIRGK